MNDLKNNFSIKYILFYLSWTIAFAIIPLMVVRLERVTPGIIILAIVISAILSIPATYSFLKVLNKKNVENNDINLDLFPDEKIILKNNASMKKGILMFGGTLYLTDKRILFIGTEFFDRNKKLMNIHLNRISEHTTYNNQLKIKDDSSKKFLILANVTSEFHSKLSNALK